MNPAHENLAQSLAHAWRTFGNIPLPPAGQAPASRADAYAIQDRIAEILGERVAGWKVGAAIRAVQILEGHDGPIPGRMLESRIFENPAHIPASSYDGCKIESEFAFRTRKAVPARSRPWTRDELAGDLVFHPGLEIAGSRYTIKEGDRAATTHDSIADNGNGAAYLLGSGIEKWTGIDFEHLPVVAQIDGASPLATYSGELRRDPVDIVVETVNGLAVRGIGLAAGEIISTGSITMPTPLYRGQTYVARFGDFATLTVAMQAR